MKRVAIYRRVSTAAQVDGFSLESQREALVRLAESRDETWEDFCDAGISGEQFEERPALMDMLARLNEFDAVLVVDLSRLARNELVSAIIRSELMSAGVTVVTPSGEIDLTAPKAT